jgi:hypothetical protein
VEEDIDPRDFLAMRHVNRKLLTDFFGQVGNSGRRSTKKSRVIPEFSISLDASPIKPVNLNAAL